MMELGFALGQCRMSGREFFFHAPTVDRLPDHLVGMLIAHELGHVFLFAVDHLEHVPADGRDPCPLLQEEAVAEVMMVWGFDEGEKELDRWLVQHSTGSQ